MTSPVVYAVDIHVSSMRDISQNGFLTVTFSDLSTAIVEFDSSTNPCKLEEGIGGVFCILQTGIDANLDKLTDLTNSIAIDVYEGSSGNFKLSFKVFLHSLRTAFDY